MSKKFSITKGLGLSKGVAALLCVGFLWTTSPVLAQIGDTSDPRLAAPATVEQFPDHDSILMLDDIRFEVAPDRSYIFDEHDAVKALTKDGVDENAVLVRVVDTSEASVEVLMARTIKADGRVLKADPPELVPLAPESEVYKSMKRFSLRFPELEVGDVVEFHIRTTHKAKSGGHFWATTYVQNPMPILDSTFTVSVPDGVYFRTATPGHPESAPAKKSISKNGVNYSELRWEIKDESAYEFSAMGPKAISLLKRIEVSSFKDWSEVSEYLQKDWQAHSRLSEGLVLRVAGWLPATGAVGARASALVKELNKTRKIASFLEDEPVFHDPGRVFPERIVSSGDAALLTSVALSSAGIPNIPVLTFGVNAQSLSDELPIPEKVNKIVLEIPRADGSSLWFDPVSPGFIQDTLPGNTSDTAAMSWDARFDGDPSTLTDLSMASAMENREELAVEGRLERSGRAELTVQFDRYGSSALDSRQAARDIKEEGREARDRALQAFFRNTTRAYGPRARLLGRYFELDADVADPFTLSFTVAVPDFAQIEDQTMLVPLPRFLSSSLRTAARDRNRKTPLVFDQPYQQDVRIHLIFPEGSEVTNVPDSVQKKTPEAEFVATGRAKGNEVWYVGRLTVFDPWIEDDALARGLATLDAALKSEDTILKVELPAGGAGSTTIEESSEDED